MKQNFIPVLSLVIFVSCSSIIEKEQSISVSTHKFNTIIIVNLKNENDAKFIPLQQYDKYRLENYGIVAPPEYNEENKKLKRILSISLNAPSLLLLGFNELYIEPGDTVEVNYEVLFKSKEIFKDTISIVRGNSIVIRANGNLISAVNNFAQEIKSNIDSAALGRIINQNNINFFTEDFLGNEKSLLNTTYNKKALKNVIDQLFFSQILLNGNRSYASLTLKKKQILKNLLIKLSIEISNNNTPKYWPYWFAINKFYNVLYKRNEVENADPLKSAIAEFQYFDEETKQFLYLLTLRNTKPSNKISLQISTLITDSAFTRYKQNVIKRNTSGVTNDVINNYILLDVNKNPVIFKDVFSKTSVPYLYIDFCGTWCKPCISEIAEYSVNQKFRDSKLLRPIWLFFENDDKSWVNTIKEYKLPVDDCFLLINDEQFGKQFGIEYGWQGEFPHHFIFSNKGKMIDNAAESLTVLDLAKYK